MSNVTLTAAVRQNLLSLQSTSDLIARTQGRLSTGLKVAKAIDDPVNFFQAKGLTDRATDFTDKKQGIDQGISTLTAATDAITGVTSLVQQLKGLATNAKSSTTVSELENIITQYNELKVQMNNLALDATYQGLNMVNGTGSTLTVNFSNDTASVLNVASIDIRSNQFGLAVNSFSANSGGPGFNIAALSAGTRSSILSAGGGLATEVSGFYGSDAFDAATVTVYGQTAQTYSAGDTITLRYGGVTFTVGVTSSVDDYGNMSGSFMTAGEYAVGTSVTFLAITGGLSAESDSGGDFSAQSAGTGVSAGMARWSAYFSGTDFSTRALGFGLIILGGTSVTLTETDAIRTVGIGYTTEMNNRVIALNSDLTTLRSNAQVLGSNIATLKTRLTFTKDYVTTLTAGAGKLTLADLNEEGANLLALQTRQQLGIQSLAFAGQSEQSILGLFR